MVAKKKTKSISEIVFYVEGDPVLRGPMRQFFGSLADKARAHGIQEFTIRMGGSGGVTHRLFCSELERRTDALIFLIVDSESDVKGFGKPWQHLEKRPDGSLKRPKAAQEDDCHLMVQAMEAWFLACPAAIKAVIKDIRTEKLPGESVDIEAISKDSHEEIINGAIPVATNPNRQREYSKKRDAPQILAAVNVDKVRERLPHCKRIFDVVESAVNKL